MIKVSHEAIFDAVSSSDRPLTDVEVGRLVFKNEMMALTAYKTIRRALNQFVSANQLVVTKIDADGRHYWIRERAFPRAPNDVTP